MRLVDYDLDRADFSAFLREYGFTEAQMLAMSQRDHDLAPMPEGFGAVRLGPSELHGMGMFAARDVLAGEWLAPARLRLKRTPAGRYTNHAKHPNCVMLPFDPSVPAGVGDLWLVAAENVKAGDELTVNYRPGWTGQRGRCPSRG